MFNITGKGDYKDTMAFLKRLSPKDLYSDLDRFGKMGVAALARATPSDSGKTANSWGYRIMKGREGAGAIAWFNTNEYNDVNVAVILQYGHGTGTGGYVAGRDYINPAMQPIFDQIVEDIMKRVNRG